MLNRRSFLGALAGLPVLGHIMQRAPLPTDTPLVVNGFSMPDGAFNPNDWTITTTAGDTYVSADLYHATNTGTNARWYVDFAQPR